MPHRHRVVLHREQVLEVPSLAVARERAATGMGGVQQGRDDAVACVEVRLPVDRVVLVEPRDVPERHARKGHGGVARAACPQAVLGVVPLDERGQREADVAHDLGRDEAEPPPVVVGVHPSVHPGRLAQVRESEVVRHLFVRLRAPDERLQVDGLGERVQHRAVEQVEHVPADDHRPSGVACEPHGAGDALGLDRHVVVEQDDEVALTRIEGLGHRAREPAGAAEVRLLDQWSGRRRARRRPRRSRPRREPSGCPGRPGTPGR